jgi:thiamine biosynthesis lipoprotein
MWRFTLPLIFLVFLGCSQTPGTSQVRKIKFEGKAQGTYYAVTYYAVDTVVNLRQIDSLLDAFNQCASIYDPQSIISRINRNDSSVKIDAMFEAIFKRSMEVSESTQGAFDVTVCQLVNAWGFGFKNKADVTKELIDSLFQFTGYKKVKLENGKVIKENPGIMLDFNAIAQGFSVDVLSRFLESKGIKDYLVDIGGEIRGSGKKPGGESFTVAIEKPATDMYSKQELQVKLHLDNISLATSGNYRKYYEENGVRYSHTIDPSTGYPAKNTLLSASVIAKDCITADAYATAFMVMGLEKTQAFLKYNPNLGLEAYCIYAGEGVALKTWSTKGFEERIINSE